MSECLRTCATEKPLQRVKEFEQCCTALLAQREMQKSLVRSGEKNNAHFCYLVWLRRQQMDNFKVYAALLDDSVVQYQQLLLAYDAVMLNFRDIQ
jgi:hypothetical protein